MSGEQARSFKYITSMKKTKKNIFNKITEYCIKKNQNKTKEKREILVSGH